MILYLNTSGRFGHQLSMFIILYLYATKYNIPFYYPLYNQKYLAILDKKHLNHKLIIKNIGFFENIILQINLLFLKYIVRDKNSNYWKSKYPFLDTSYSNKLVGKEVLEKIFTSNFDVVCNNLFIDNQTFVQYRNLIKKEIKILANINNKIQNEINQFRQNGFIIISVHIRQTDFKTFLNGKYYFNLDIYFNILQKTINKLSTKCQIFICSDENIETNQYNFTNLHYNKRDYIEDFLILKNSDYIISTRSAFSMMACYLGNAKIYQIIDDKIEIEDIEFLDYETLMTKYFDINQPNNRTIN